MPVGSPTMAKSIFGNRGNTLSMPFLPETSSSQEARKMIEDPLCPADISPVMGRPSGLFPNDKHPVWTSSPLRGRVGERVWMNACNNATNPPPQSLLPRPYSLSPSTVGVKGSRCHPATGFTVSIWALSKMVGPLPTSPKGEESRPDGSSPLGGIRGGLAHHTLFPCRWGVSPFSFMYASSTSAAAFSSRLTLGAAISFFSSSTASFVCSEQLFSIFSFAFGVQS